MRTRSTLRPVDSNTSKRNPSSSITSPVCGIRPASSLTRPATVDDSFPSGRIPNSSASRSTSNFAYDFFHQVLNRHQSGHSTILVNHNSHANVVTLHFAQEISTQLAFRDKIHISAHHGVNPPRASFRVRNLQDILCVHDALYVVNSPIENGNTGEGLRSQQLDKLFDGCVNGNGYNFRTRLHRFAHGLFTEFHNRLD